MKIAVRGGHTERCTGAIGILNELTEDRKVKDAVIKYLKQLGHTVLDVTPPVNYTSNQSTDLGYGVNKANDWGADLFISVHFNKAYNSYNGAIGTESWVYSANDSFKDEEYAKRICDKLATLGFKNRGVKYSGDSLYECRKTKMMSVIIEVCFVEATEDVAIYRKYGADKVGQLIAEGIANKSVAGGESTNSGSSSSDRRYDGKVATTKDVLNVRSGAGTGYGVLGVLNKGQSVKLFSKLSNGWFEIYYGSNGGFVSGEYLNYTVIPDEKPVPAHKEQKIDEYSLVQDVTAYFNKNYSNYKKGDSIVMYKVKGANVDCYGGSNGVMIPLSVLNIPVILQRNEPIPVKKMYRVLINGVQVGAFSEFDNAINSLKDKSEKDKIEITYK